MGIDLHIQMMRKDWLRREWAEIPPPLQDESLPYWPGEGVRDHKLFHVISGGRYTRCEGFAPLATLGDQEREQITPAVFSDDHVAGGELTLRDFDLFRARGGWSQSTADWDNQCNIDFALRFSCLLTLEQCMRNFAEMRAVHDLVLVWRLS